MRFDYGDGIVIYKAFCRDRLVHQSERRSTPFGTVMAGSFVLPKGTHTYYLDLVNRLSVGYGLENRVNDYHRMCIAMMVYGGYGYRKKGQEFPPYDETEKEFYEKYPKAFNNRTV